MIKTLISLVCCTLLSVGQSHYSLTLSKQKSYVTEPIIAILTLEHNDTEPISKIHFKPLKLEGYAVLPLTKTDQNQKQHRYFLIPHLPGTHLLPPQSIEIAHKDPHTYRNIWKTLQTLSLTHTVLPLPSGITTVGNYTLQSHIDQQSTEANKPINLSITIKGTGSLENMQKLQLPLDNALVFASDPSIHTEIYEGTYRSTFTQHFAIVADKDFTLPILSWQYFNTDTGLRETLSTPSYHIAIKTPLHKSLLLRYLLLLLAGIGIGLLLAFLLITLRHRKKTLPSSIAAQIHKAKTDKALYSLLLPYANHAGISEVLRQLEENIYHKGTYKVKRSEVAHLLS